MATEPFDLIRTPSGRTIRDVLQSAGYDYQALSPGDVRDIRNAMSRGGSAETRSIVLPPDVVHKSLQQPLLRDLLVTRIGYYHKAAGHYLPQPEGSQDHIIHDCAEGKGWLQIRDTRWVVPTGTALLIPRGQPHAYGADAEDPWSVYWIHFTGAQAGHYFDFLNVKPNAPLIHLPDAVDVLAAFERIYSSMQVGHTSENLITASMSCIGLLYGLAKGAQSISAQAHQVRERLERVIEFMRQNLGNPIRLEELAQLACMSPNRFGDAFRDNFGCPPVDYFNRMRIQKACQLLTKNDRRVQDIAREVGYEDQYYFSRTFKRYLGMSPLQFRKR